MKISRLHLAVNYIVGLVALASCAMADQTVTMLPIKLSGKLIYADGSPAADAIMHVYFIDRQTHAVSTLTYNPNAGGMVSCSVDFDKRIANQSIIYAMSPSGVGFWNASARGAWVEGFDEAVSSTQLLQLHQNAEPTCVLRPFTEVKVHLTGPDGAPVAHVHLCPWGLIIDGSTYSWSEAVPGAWNVTTNDNGDATIPSLPQGTMLFIHILDSPFPAPLDRCKIVLANAPSTSNVTIQCDKSSSISGTVQFAATKLPVVGIKVSAWRRGDFSEAVTATTDSRGSFVLNGLSSGHYEVSTQAFSRTYGSWIDHPSSVEVSPGTAISGIQFNLIHGGLITGPLPTNGPAPRPPTSLCKQTQ